MNTVETFLKSVYKDYVDAYISYKENDKKEYFTSLDSFLSQKDYLNKDLAMAYSYLLGVCDTLEEIDRAEEEITIMLSGYQEKEYDIPVITRIHLCHEKPRYNIGYELTLRMEDYLDA